MKPSSICVALPICLIVLFSSIWPTISAPVVVCPLSETDERMLHHFLRQLSLDYNAPDSHKSHGIINDARHVTSLTIINEPSGVPPIVACLKHLTHLTLENTPIHAFEHLGSSLTHLSISKTSMHTLPAEYITQLTRLTELKIFQTHLKTLPESIGDLSSLRTLVLSDNHLEHLPKNIAQLKSLRHIDLDNNHRLRSIQQLNGLPNLTHLKADRCHIEEIPMNLPQLHHLHMGRNQLTELIEIGSLGDQTSHHVSFYFSGNRIGKISPSIESVKTLHSLNLNNNQLNDLPGFLGKNSSLRCLSIQNNPFKNVHLKHLLVQFEYNNSQLKICSSLSCHSHC